MRMTFNSNSFIHMVLNPTKERNYSYCNYIIMSYVGVTCLTRYRNVYMSHEPLAQRREIREYISEFRFGKTVIVFDYSASKQMWN